MNEKSTTPQVRKLTTGRTFHIVAPNISNSFTGLRAVPWIRLKGVWLERAGFSVGQPIRLEVQQGRVVIYAQ